MGALLGLASALGFGVSDFLAGLASRRMHFLWVTLVGEAVGVGVSTVSATVLGGSGSTSALAWGAVSGLGSAGGTLALYRGYGHGAMAVAGPLSAVGAAALPSLAGAALGESLPPLVVVGVVLALPAIWYMASVPGGSTGSIRAGVWDGIVSGVGFAFLFVALKLAGTEDGLWPVAAGQMVALVAVAVSALVVRPPVSLERGGKSRWSTVVPVAAGALGIVATMLYFFASHTGLLAVAAVLTSVYPGVTVGLAALVIHERPSRRQVVGLLLGAVAVALIVVA